MKNSTIALVAGEPSGDTLGAALISAIRKREPTARFVGVGGAKMRTAGLTSLFPMELLSVRGYVEVLRNFAEIVRMRSTLLKTWLKDPPAVFIGVDAPDFNLGLEERLKARGIPTVQYVSPQIWAWRPERVAKLKRAASLVLAVFPFEAPLLQREQIPVRFVGHPLADMLPLVSDKSAARERLELPREARIIALLPGSRRGVIRNTADLYIQTAQRLKQQLPHTIFVVAMVSEETKAQFTRALQKNHAQDLPCTLIVGRAQDVMAASDAILVTAGTASLEAALVKRPMVITYRLSRLSYWTLRNKIRGPHIGLPNILAGREVVPELVQADATPQRLADALLVTLRDKQNAGQLARIFTELHEKLRQGSSDKAAAAVLELIHG